MICDYGNANATLYLDRCQYPCIKVEDKYSCCAKLTSKRGLTFIIYAAWSLLGLSIVHDVMVYYKVKWLPIIYFVYKSEDFQPITQDEEEIKCLRRRTRKKLMSIPTRIAMYLNSLFVEPSSFENSIITVHT